MIEGYEERNRRDANYSQNEEDTYIDTYDDFDFESIIRVDRQKRQRREEVSRV